MTPASDGAHHAPARFVIIMGVAGSGKTTVGRLLAHELGWRFWDADDFHSPGNIAKMHAGIALTDDDRRPWLRTLRELVERSLHDGISGVLACSALKSSYREILGADLPTVRFVYLRASRALLQARLHSRHAHFMNPDLLDSQFETLEEPHHAVVIDASLPPGAIVSAVAAALEQS